MLNRPDRRFRPRHKVGKSLDCPTQPRLPSERPLAGGLFALATGALLAKASRDAKTMKEIDAWTPGAARALVDALKQSHAAAVAAIGHGTDRYLLRPAGAGDANAAPVASAVSGRSAGRLLVEDGEQVHLEKVLSAVRPEVNACYDGLLERRKGAHGRIGAVAKRIADAYDIEVDRAVKALTALFEPLRGKVPVLPDQLPGEPHQRPAQQYGHRSTSLESQE